MRRRTLRLLSSRFTIFLLLVSLGFFGVSQYQKWQVSRQISQQIASLEQESRQVEAKNEHLRQSLEYVASGAGADKVAREQMNLQREGEIPVVLLGESGKTESSAATTPQTEPIWKQWWQYFFAYDKTR